MLKTISEYAFITLLFIGAVYAMQYSERLNKAVAHLKAPQEQLISGLTQERNERAPDKRL